MASLYPLRRMPPSESGVRARWGRLTGQPTRGFLMVVFALVGTYLLVAGSDAPELLAGANLLGPLVLGGATAWTGFRLVRGQPLAIWTPYAWFLGGILVFYVAGPLVYVVGGADVLRYLQSSLPVVVTPADLLRTNLLNAVGIFSILVGFGVMGRLWPGPRRRKLPSAREQRLIIKAVALLLVVVGGAFQFFVILPFQFGLFDFILPGVIVNLGNLYLFGLMAFSYVAASGNRRWRVALYVLWIIQVAVSLLQFSKTAVVLAIIMPPLGAFLADRRLARLLGWGFVAGLVYASIGPLIQFGRGDIFESSGTIYRAPLSERVSVVQRWAQSGTGSTATSSNLSAWEMGWARLSHSHVQTFAMSRYDQGQPGDTLWIAAVVLIPRILWPEKPITVQVSGDFYEQVTGTRGQTYLALGIFGEGYWNLGWFGVVALGLAAGAIYAVVGAFAMSWMRRGAFEYMPSIFLGIQIGITGTTQFFGNGFVGSAGFIVVYALVMSRLIKLIVHGGVSGGSQGYHPSW